MEIIRYAFTIAELLKVVAAMETLGLDVTVRATGIFEVHPQDEARAGEYYHPGDYRHDEPRKIGRTWCHFVGEDGVQFRARPLTCFDTGQYRIVGRNQ